MGSSARVEIQKGHTDPHAHAEIVFVIVRRSSFVHTHFIVSGVGVIFPDRQVIYMVNSVTPPELLKMGIPYFRINTVD